MTDYWLGVLTIPALLVTLALIVAACLLTLAAFARAGITFNARWRRDVDSISDYTLRRDIWWERAFGPIFVGGWYREKPRIDRPSLRLVNRWIGLGSARGPNVMAFHSRNLGEVTQWPEEARLTWGAIESEEKR